MDEAQAAALGYLGGVKRVRSEGVPLWRDGTATVSHSLYYRGVWAALALLVGLGSVSVSVFSRGDLTLAHIVVPAVLCALASLFAAWQVFLMVTAARRGSPPLVFAASIVAAIAALGSIGLLLQERAWPALAELWAIHTGDAELGHLGTTISDDERTLLVLGSYALDSGDVVVKLLDRHPQIREIILGGPGGRAGAAIKMFNAFRKKRLATRADYDCFSACTVAFLGGVDRSLGPEGRLGFHRGSFPGMSESDMYETDLADRRFLTYRANLSPDFVDRVMKTPPESIWIPTREELLAGKVITR